MTPDSVQTKGLKESEKDFQLKASFYMSTIGEPTPEAGEALKVRMTSIQRRSRFCLAVSFSLKDNRLSKCHLQEYDHECEASLNERI